MKSFKGGVIPGRFLAIPANDANYKVYGSTTVTEDCILHNITPHMHLVGKQIKVTIKMPNKPKETLLEIGSWDYNWQETYFLKDPLKLPKGTILDVEAIYDNSAKNPNNPNNPPKLVTFGEQTTNEMCFVFFGRHLRRQRTLPLRQPLRRRQRPPTPTPGKGQGSREEGGGEAGQPVTGSSRQQNSNYVTRPSDLCSVVFLVETACQVLGATGGTSASALLCATKNTTGDCGQHHWRTSRQCHPLCKSRSATDPPGGRDNLLSRLRSSKRLLRRAPIGQASRRRARCLLSLRDPDNKLSAPSAFVLAERLRSVTLVVPGVAFGCP